MSLKRSQNYLYFQNKAQHYHNIHSARSSLPPAQLRTLPPRTNNRDIPYNSQYEIDFQNRRLANRILSISVTPRKEVEAQGGYSRFNKFEREFRQKNPLRTEEERQISLENAKIQRHISATRPRVGNSSAWEAEYKDKANYRRLRSRYEQNKGKDGLSIEKEPFLLDPYLKYLDTLAPASPPSSLAHSRPRHVRLEKEKLFLLPTFSPEREGVI